MKPAKEQSTKEPSTKGKATQSPATKEPAEKGQAVVQSSGTKEAANKEKAKAQKGRTRDGRRKESAIARYFRQTWAELKKTNWPTRREAARMTGIVLAVTVAMSAMLGVIDWLFSILFSFLIKSSG